MSQNCQNSDKEKAKIQVKKLLALSKSPFKAEADVALKKARALIHQYELGKTKINHPEFGGYDLLLYRAFIESCGYTWHESYCMGSASVLQRCKEHVEKCVYEIEFGASECEKTLIQNNKNSIGVLFWYKKGFYNGLCEGLKVEALLFTFREVSSLDYGSQLYVLNTAHSHGLDIGRYYNDSNKDN